MIDDRDPDLDRRSLLLVLCALPVVAALSCRKESSEATAQTRCKHCGMKIDPTSQWRTELVAADGSITPFDTPRCALTSWRTGKSQGLTLRVQEYYERKWRDAAELRFIVGGDVPGPMGADLVPVDASRAAKFIQDHGADRALRLDEVTVDVLNTLK